MQIVSQSSRQPMRRVKIRKLRAEDLAELAELYKQFWAQDSNLEKMREKYKEIETDPKHIVLCATVDGVVVGSIMGIICEELYGECRPFLVVEDLIVDEHCRRKGIGKDLMGELIAYARQQGCGQVQFISEANRKGAIAFYRTQGYDPNLHVGFKKSLQA